MNGSTLPVPRHTRLVPAFAVASLAIAGCTSFPAPAVETSHTTFYHQEIPKRCDTPDEQILASVVRVATSDGGDASGVVVSSNLVLTAAHVVIGADYTLVRVSDEYRHAMLLGIDDTSDLALLAVDTGTLQPLRLTHLDLSNYEEVWAIGFPLALEQVTTHGHVTDESQGRIFASAPINAGASGGGLMRCRDGVFELAGLIRGYGAYRIGDQLVRLEDLSIHTPADQIQQFVLAHGLDL